MSNFASHGGYAIAFGFHKLFALAFLIGLLFIVVWALKNLKKDKLKKYAIKLMVIGLLGCLILSAFGGFGYKKFKHLKDGKGGYGYSHDGMWTCMKDEGCLEEIEEMMMRRGLK